VWILKLDIINILFAEEEGVIVTDSVLEAVTNEDDVVVLDVESVAVITWITCPALAETPAKLKTPLPFVWRNYLGNLFFTDSIELSQFSVPLTLSQYSISSWSAMEG